MIERTSRIRAVMGDAFPLAERVRAVPLHAEMEFDS
jgi:hypothetical protein